MYELVSELEYLEVLGDGDLALESRLATVSLHGFVAVGSGVVREHQVLHVGLHGDPSCLARVEMAIVDRALVITDPRRRFADEEIRACGSLSHPIAHPGIAGVRDGGVLEAQAIGQRIDHAVTVVHTVAGEDAQRITEGDATVVPRHGRHSDGVQEREGQSLARVRLLEVNAVLLLEGLRDVIGRVQVQPGERLGLGPVEPVPLHAAAQAGLQESGQEVMIWVSVADGQVSDIVRPLTDLLEPFGDARRGFEQEVSITFAPANEEPGVMPALPTRNGVTGTGTKNRELNGQMSSKIGHQRNVDNSSF